jgi:uncharacterized membrane protein YhaH (DUF805 family)
MRGLAFLILALSAVVVFVVIPYLLLAGIASFAGCFLYWSAATAVVIVAAAIYTRRWRDVQ